MTIKPRLICWVLLSLCAACGGAEEPTSTLDTEQDTSGPSEPDADEDGATAVDSEVPSPLEDAIPRLNDTPEEPDDAVGDPKETTTDAAPSDGTDAAPSDGDVTGTDCGPERDVVGLWREPAVQSPTIEASTVISEEGLIAYWPLDGSWADHLGVHHLQPFREGGFSQAEYIRGPTNQAYGPTGFSEDNGAEAPEFTEVEQDPLEGLSMEGWVRVTGNSTGGTIFGFGGSGWENKKLFVSIDWGHLTVNMGQTSNGAKVRFTRIGNDSCWHHVAVVFPPGYASPGAGLFTVYIDGEPAEPNDEGSNTQMVGSEFFGEPFRVGTFGGDQASNMQLDEVRLWGRSLSSDEVQQLSVPRGEQGDACPGAQPPDWAPGERCDAPTGEVPITVDLGLRVVSPDTVVLITDPNAWVKERIHVDCGEYLEAMAVADAHDTREYFYAAMETFESYRPLIAGSIFGDDHFRVGRMGADQCEDVLVHEQNAWPQGIREFFVPHIVEGEGPVWTHRGEVIYFSYLTLSEPMVDGEHYVFRDRWGHATELVYAAEQSLSWAIKVNQVGYRSDGPKFAYLGFWMGGEGALNLAKFHGEPFELRRTDDDATAWTGSINYRGYTAAPNPNPDSGTAVINAEGEIIQEVDFSGFSEPGEYYVYVPGLGRSWPFRVGNDATGEAYYVHSRGLYHQRCSPLEADYTAWPRGDIHATYRGLYPPIDGPFYEAIDKSADHSAEGWGYLDANDNYSPPPSVFELISWAKTDELLPEGVGGWHDAADFDRRPQHFYIVKELAQTYLLFPDNFADGQLNLPESGNGVPDILDQAAFGVDVYRKIQGEDGSATIKIEATSHPKIADAGADTQPYYAAIATRGSSLWYANHAALVGRAMAVAGATEQASLFIDSAADAWAFGTDPDIRVSTEFLNDEGELIRWIEPPSPHPRRFLLAAIQLWLATDDQVYRQVFDDPEVAAAFSDEVAHFAGRNSTFDIAAVARHPDLFPDGWGEQAHAAIIEAADEAASSAEEHAYRRLHPAPSSDTYTFWVMAWGSHHGGRQARALLSAWALTGDQVYRDPLNYLLDWFQGANPQGRAYTTGLGHYSTANLLHLPTDVDDIDEPVPGITPYLLTTGSAYQIRTHVHGLFEGPNLAYGYPGVAIGLMPPPFDNTDVDTTIIGDIIIPNIPLWRRYLPFEYAIVAQNEFTVSETLVTKAAVAGALLEPGWSPSTELLEHVPYGPERYRQDLWLQP